MNREEVVRAQEGGHSSSRGLTDRMARVPTGHLDRYQAGWVYFQGHTNDLHWQYATCDMALHVSAYGVCMHICEWFLKEQLGFPPCENRSDATPASQLPLWLKSCVPPVSPFPFCLHRSSLCSHSIPIYFNLSHSPLSFPRNGFPRLCKALLHFAGSPK